MIVNYVDGILYELTTDSIWGDTEPLKYVNNKLEKVELPTTNFIPNSQHHIVWIQQGHDSTAIFTIEGIIGITEYIEKYIIEHPNYKLVSLRIKTEYIDKMPMRCGGEFPGVDEIILGILQSITPQ